MAFTLLKEDKAKAAIKRLLEGYPDAKYYLDFTTPLELLVAAVLSAQTHDEVVNAATPELFRKYEKAVDYAKARPEDLLKYIGRVSFAGNKAKNIIGACRIINGRFSGSVPRRMEDLVELPGIGRKTANTILINAFGIVEGIPVDTWVIKLSHRIGLSRERDPDKIEHDLALLLVKRQWKKIAYVLKSHGKKICRQVPICSACIISDICPKNDVKKRL